MEHRDLDAVLHLFSSVAGERMWIGTEPETFRREKLRDVLGRAIAADHGMFVADDDGHVVGMLTTYPHEEYGWTLGMMVDRDRRGAGIGGALLARAVAWARERGLPHLSLLVFPHNARALALYRREGFEEIERYPADVTRKTGEVWDTILMQKPLQK
jgi:GNAT superfamily N-acetyltransferase